VSAYQIPDDLKYTPEDETWVRLDGQRAKVGVTDYYQSERGDVLNVEIRSVGNDISQGEELGYIETSAGKAAFRAPLSGKVVAVNESISNEPKKINQDPYTDGWIVEMEVSSSDEAGTLLDAPEYKNLVGQAAQFGLVLPRVDAKPRGGDVVAE
jgi:glycine cleavage system H protein